MSDQPAVTMQGSEGLWQWLSQLNISLAFTTYQSNRLFLVGCRPDGRLAVNERLFDKPMGLCLRDNRLYMACRYQLWQFDNRLPEGETHRDADALFVPSLAYTTGDLNVHDVVATPEHQLLFINTDFSCLATLRPGYSFQPLWQPPFISKLVAEDRCHLNGLALQNGQPTYVTACSRTDEAAGWRHHRNNGGIVMHIPTDEIIAGGLSMPHSPRWYRGRLWLLNSGAGEFGYVDGGQFVPLLFCPGFVRGLAFYGDYAIVGLSKLRSTTFGGLTLETRLAEQQNSAQCGLMVIDLNTGQCVHWLHIDGVIEELFDVAVLPGIRQPKALGLQSDDIERLVNFPGSGGLITTKPAVVRPGLGKPPIAGVPRQTGIPGTDAVKYQQVHHLNPDNLIPYEAMTYPSLQSRWQSQPQRGELLGVSASVAGEMVGFAVAERFPLANGGQVGELLSLYVSPGYRRQGIGGKLANLIKQRLDKLLTE